MIEQNPEILYDLYRARASELQQRAATFRLAKLSNSTPTFTPGRIWAQLGALVVTNLHFFGIGQTDTPAPSCC